MCVCVCVCVFTALVYEKGDKMLTEEPIDYTSQLASNRLHVLSDLNSFACVVAKEINNWGIFPDFSPELKLHFCTWASLLVFSGAFPMCERTSLAFWHAQKTNKAERRAPDYHVEINLHLNCVLEYVCTFPAETNLANAQFNIWLCVLVSLSSSFFGSKSSDSLSNWFQVCWSPLLGHLCLSKFISGGHQDTHRRPTKFYLSFRLRAGFCGQVREDHW